jgi:hypothetical protein
MKAGDPEYGSEVYVAVIANQAHRHCVIASFLTFPMSFQKNV